MADVLDAPLPPLPAAASDDAESVEIPMISRENSASPAPFTEPSLALDAIPQLDRSVSTASSSASTSSRLEAVDGGLPVNKRRGYMRPQPTTFADSARNRESVMSLGSIAHLQYYFARTGLLDGKGAQLARRRQTPSGSYEYKSTSGQLKDTPITDSPDTFDFGSDADAMRGPLPIDSPVEQEDEPSWQESPLMLPPTVSTYNQRPAYVPPPPDIKTLRKELLQAVEDACKVLEELHKSKTPSAPSTPRKGIPLSDTLQSSPATPGPDEAVKDENRAMHQVQGLHLLDVTTLAIRAAKNYYTAHERPQRLYSIKSERKIRTELYQVLEVLKKMAARNFAGGIRGSEQGAILMWIVGISDLLKTEEDQERAEIEEREKWRWRAGDWTGREREREWSFFKSLMPQDEPELPEWPAVGGLSSGAASATVSEAITTSASEPEPTAEPSTTTTATVPPWRSPFLERLRTGVLLVHAHNAAVRMSKRQFEEITKWHTDTAKPYRRAENVRYFVKAAERRWDVKLAVDVLSFVSDDKSEDVQMAAWTGFDAALMEWCGSVRGEITRDWEQKEKERDKAQAQAQAQAQAHGQASPKTPS